jgi:hypothetical protein
MFRMNSLRACKKKSASQGNQMHHGFLIRVLVRAVAWRSKRVTLWGDPSGARACKREKYTKEKSLPDDKAATR